MNEATDEPHEPDELDLHIAKCAAWRAHYADLFGGMLKDIAEPWIEASEITAILPDQGILPDHTDINLFRAVFHMNVVQIEGGGPEIELQLCPTVLPLTPAQFRVGLASALHSVADLVDGNSR